MEDGRWKICLTCLPTRQAARQVEDEKK